MHNFLWEYEKSFIFCFDDSIKYDCVRGHPYILRWVGPPYPVLYRICVTLRYTKIGRDGGKAKKTSHIKKFEVSRFLLTFKSFNHRETSVKFKIHIHYQGTDRWKPWIQRAYYWNIEINEVINSFLSYTLFWTHIFSWNQFLVEMRGNHLNPILAYKK